VAAATAVAALAAEATAAAQAADVEVVRAAVDWVAVD
tara:strand:- start:263 stop:373 length:111 start_codon:yes stop_codon:yes gene_type:complete